MAEHEMTTRASRRNPVAAFLARPVPLTMWQCLALWTVAMIMGAVAVVVAQAPQCETIIAWGSHC